MSLNQKKISLVLELKMNKKCTKCGEEYPATKEYFYQEKRFKIGLQAQCKACINVATAIWRKKAGLQYNREHYQKNKEKYYKSCQKYRTTLRGYITQLIGNIKARCTNPNCKEYKYYGGRGIKCEFTGDELYSWIIVKEIDPRGLQIHRIDNDSNYILNNIEFLDRFVHIKRHYELESEKTEFGFKSKGE